MTIEKLTEADRDRLDYKGERKALHIIDAANARIAELERYADAQKAVVLEARRDRTAANARVAELEALRAENNSDNQALRAQVGAANEATKAAVIRWQRAESEAASLRARLAAAIALLREWLEQADSWEWNAAPYGQTEEFISTVPALPGDTA